MLNLKYLTAAHDVLSYETEDERTVVVDRGSEAFAALADLSPAPFIPPPEPDPLEIEREGMTVTRLQARAALLQAGHLDRIEKLVNGGIFGGGTAGAMTKLAWNEAAEFHRNSPTIAALADLIGLDGATLDDLFRAAKLIRF
jgi:hypothetical protein